MIEYSDPREGRDRFLVITSVVSAALALLYGFRDWVQDELIDLIPRAERAVLFSGGTDIELNQMLRRIRDIEQREFPECTEDLKARTKEISDGAPFDGIVESRRYLESPCSRFENMVNELLSYRERLLALEGDQTNTEGS